MRRTAETVAWFMLSIGWILFTAVNCAIWRNTRCEWHRPFEMED